MSTRAVWAILVAGHAVPFFVWSRAGWLPGLLSMALFHGMLALITFTRAGILLCGGIRSFSTREKEVCITIDDGPGEDTAAVLDLLASHRAQAVFFLIGNRAAARPECVQAITAAGHPVENHTLHHHAGWHWSFGPARLTAEIAGCQETLARLTGQAPRWYRPPAGFANPFTSAILKKAGLRCAGWTARGLDAVDTDVDRILRRITTNLRPGSIILVHQGQPHHVEVLRGLLDWLSANRWQVVIPPDFQPGRE